MQATDPSSSPAADDAASQRLDREHTELFQELRSVTPGAEVLFAILLGGIFSSHTDELSSLEHAVYYVTFLCAGLALVLLLAPASFHRLRFRRYDKEALMRLANKEVIVALALIAASIIGGVTLMSSVLFSLPFALGAGSAFAAGILAVWWWLPLRRELGEPRS